MPIDQYTHRLTAIQDLLDIEKVMASLILKIDSTRYNNVELAGHLHLQRIKVINPVNVNFPAGLPGVLSQQKKFHDHGKLMNYTQETAWVLKFPVFVVI
jgi:hypothetical protein